MYVIHHYTYFCNLGVHFAIILDNYAAKKESENHVEVNMFVDKEESEAFEDQVRL